MIFRTSACSALSIAIPLLLVACGDDDTSGPAPSPSGSTSSSGGAAATPGEATIANCPQQTSLIQGKDWISCIGARSFVGIEPFTNAACELKIDADGGFTYYLAGEATLAAARSSWGNAATGLYQNEGSGARRIFLASLDPELPAVDGQPRLIRVNISIFGVASQDDTIEVQYLDAARARQTYNCKITSP